MDQSYQTPDQQPQRNGSGRFLSDTQKIVKRHLNNIHDVITEEDIRNVRVGLTLPGTIATAENMTEAIESKVEKEYDETQRDGRNDDTTPHDNPLTPWDVTT